MEAEERSRKALKFIKGLPCAEHHVEHCTRVIAFNPQLWGDKVLLPI